MTKIAFLGLGAMGSRMARNLLAAGHTVSVWNRSPRRVEALVEAGATPHATPREAVTGARVVCAMLTDDEASRDVWLNERTGALYQEAIAAGHGGDNIHGVAKLYT